jgi:diketogulonate reductase-like aldo/keto reductase
MKTLKNGVKIPMVSVGTAGSNLPKVFNDLNIAIDADVFHIDTAHDYCSDGTAELCTDGSNQSAIAKVIKDS